MTYKRQSNPKLAETAAFAAVAQPAYCWVEFEAQGLSGVTGLPKGKKVTATLTSPSEATPDGRAVRLHELLHARFTPVVASVANRLEVDTAAVQIAEDIRLAALGRKLGLFTPDVCFSSDVISEAFRQQLMASRDALKGIARVALASYGQPCADVDTRDISAVLDLAQVACPDWFVDALYEGVCRIEDILARPPGRVLKGKHKGKLDPKVTQARFVELASVVQDILDTVVVPPKPKPEQINTTSQGSAGIGPQPEVTAADAADGSASPSDAGGDTGEVFEGAAPDKPRPRDETPAPSLSGLVHDKTARASKRFAEALADGAASPTRTIVAETPDDLVGSFEMQSLEAAEAAGRDAATCGRGWGKLTIAHPELTRSYTGRVRRTGAPSTDGVFPAHLGRWFVDRAVLSRVGQRVGGTLLIDISGSMELSRAQLEALITAAPAVNIAAYSGDRKRAGRLTILAVRGRLVAADDSWRQHHDLLNVVDGPALAWLIKQPAPRVWFCDGIVTAPRAHGDEAFSKEAFEDALRLCRIGNIRRVTSITEAVNVFTGKLSTATISVHPNARNFTALRSKRTKPFG